MKPHQEKKKTRPYTLKTFRKGTERALRLIGLTSGASQRYESFIVNVSSWTPELSQLSTFFPQSKSRKRSWLIPASNCYQTVRYGYCLYSLSSAYTHVLFGFSEYISSVIVHLRTGRLGGGPQVSTPALTTECVFSAGDPLIDKA